MGVLLLLFKTACLQFNSKDEPFVVHKRQPAIQKIAGTIPAAKPKLPYTLLHKVYMVYMLLSKSPFIPPYMH